MSAASEAAREAAWLETTQARRPLARTPRLEAYESRMGDLDPTTTKARRAELLKACEGKP